MLSCRGNGALVIELSPDASEKANVKIRKRKGKVKMPVADGSEDLDSEHTQVIKTKREWAKSKKRK